MEYRMRSKFRMRCRFLSRIMFSILNISVSLPFPILRFHDCVDLDTAAGGEIPKFANQTLFLKNMSEV
jgi:hypothetical protein